MTQVRRKQPAITSWLLYSGPILLVVVLALVYKFFAASAAPDYSSQAKAQVQAMYAKVPDQALVTRLIEQYHDDSFNKAYTPAQGGRGASFDGEGYLRSIKHRMDGKLTYDQLHPRR